MEVAGDLGLKAEHVRLDWQRLHALGFSHSLLVLFKDTNVVLLTGEGRDAASEVAVWDPRDPYGETVFIPREDFERTSTGHALIVAPRRQPARGHPAVLDLAGSPRRGTSCSAKPLREARILQSSQASN
jgi:ABC-type bacteriocin/lantibiotic exporter with double-glycine peptidase domain